MITTNVDRAIELLDQKGKIDTRKIAKALGTKQDSIDIILSYLEEEGIVELKYGVFETIASLKRKPSAEEKAGKAEEAEEEAEELLQEEQKPIQELKPAEEKKEAAKPEPKPEVKPKQLKRLKPVQFKPELKPQPAPIIPAKEGIPLFDEQKGARRERQASRLANMMIKLFEKSQSMPDEGLAEAEKVMKSILSLAKSSKIYAQKSKVVSEFTLCSLLFSMKILFKEYRERGELETARKIYSTYNALRKSALECEKERLKYYKGQIGKTYAAIIRAIYPRLKRELKAVKPLQPEIKQALPKQQAIKGKPEAKVRVPKYDATRGTRKEQDSARLVNAMITLLEKYYTLPEENKPNAILVLNDLLKLAKESNLYHQRNPASAEFILCSLLIGIETLIKEYRKKKEQNTARKIGSTYQLMRKVSAEISKERLGYYRELIQGIYGSAMEASSA